MTLGLNYLHKNQVCAQVWAARRSPPFMYQECIKHFNVLLLQFNCHLNKTQILNCTLFPCPYRTEIYTYSESPKFAILKMGRQDIDDALRSKDASRCAGSLSYVLWCFHCAHLFSCPDCSFCCSPDLVKEWGYHTYLFRHGILGIYVDASQHCVCSFGVIQFRLKFSRSLLVVFMGLKRDDIDNQRLDLLFSFVIASLSYKKSFIM